MSKPPTIPENIGAVVRALPGERGKADAGDAAFAKMGEGFVNNLQIRKFALNKYLFTDSSVCH